MGFGRKEVSLRPATEFLAEESRSQLDAIRTAVPTAHAWHGTLVRRRKDASTFVSSGSVIALADAAGHVSNFVAVERDTTLEGQLRDQLIHSERLAAVGQLVSGVAHELNNPLQSIVGYTDLLIAVEQQQHVRGDLEEIRFAAHRAAKIVQNLLAFVRRSPAQRTPENLNAIVLSTIALRQYELAATGLVLEERYGEDLPPVLVNREEIQQILLNVMLNAEQAMRSAGPRGRLSIRTLRAGTSDVAVEVQDDGPGVPQALAGRIFEPFFTTKDVGSGTGLGLSLAIGIAEAHGGSLALMPVTSGACFRLTLPTTTMPAVATPPASPEIRSVRTGSGRRALVADDEPALGQMLQRLLNQRGFVVDLAEDGCPACDLLERHHYDVIFCDLQTPTMGGMELVDWIRRRQPAASTAFVLVTAGLLAPELQSAIESSHIPMLSKPFGAATLDGLLAKLFAERASVAPL